MTVEYSIDLPYVARLKRRCQDNILPIFVLDGMLYIISVSPLISYTFWTGLWCLCCTVCTMHHKTCFNIFCNKSGALLMTVLLFLFSLVFQERLPNNFFYGSSILNVKSFGPLVSMSWLFSCFLLFFSSAQFMPSDRVAYHNSAVMAGHILISVGPVGLLGITYLAKC